MRTRIAGLAVAGCALLSVAGCGSATPTTTASGVAVGSSDWKAACIAASSYSAANVAMLEHLGYNLVAQDLNTFGTDFARHQATGFDPNGDQISADGHKLDTDVKATNLTSCPSTTTP